MSILSEPFFHDERAAYAKLESLLWPHGPMCPRCGSLDRITPVKGGRIGLYRCGACKRQFRITVGTIFESSHVKLHLWFQAAHLLCASKKGISAHQIHRILGVTYKTAWFMCHRLREAMREGTFPDTLGGENRVVEADETYIGGKEKNKHARMRLRQGRGAVGKEAAFSLIERGGRVRSFHVPAVSAKTLKPILRAQIDGRSRLMTDEAGVYGQLGRDFAEYGTVIHSIGEYVRGDAHTNTAENYFSIFKRGIAGVYHHVSPRHLKRYRAEFDFRYNERAALGVDDTARTVKALASIVGKRLLYRDSSVG